MGGRGRTGSYINTSVRQSSLFIYINYVYSHWVIHINLELLWQKYADAWRFQPFKVRRALICCCDGVHSPAPASHFGFCPWGFAPSATRAFVVLGDGARLNLTILGSYSQIGWFCTSAANIHCQHGGSVSFMWQEVSVLATPATEQMLTEYVNHWWVKTLASVLQLYISLGPIFYLSRVTTPAENTDAAGNVPEVSVETSGQLTDSYRGHWLGRHVLNWPQSSEVLYNLQRFFCATNSHVNIVLTVVANNFLLWGLKYLCAI